MTRHYLIKVSIEGFRGINNEGQPLELTFSKEKVNSVYAVNGLGKSSVYDALSYGIFGHIPKLERLEQSEDAQAYINNRFHGQSTATIIFTFEADDGSAKTEITVTRDAVGNRTVTSPTEADPEGFLKALRSDFALLDQATFEQFIRDKSLDRGRTFSRLLGLSRLSEYRLALQKLSHAGNLSSDLKIELLQNNDKLWKEQLQSLITSLRQAYDQLTGTAYSGVFDPTTFATGVIDALKQIPTVQPYCDVQELAALDFPTIENAVSAAEKSADRDRLTKRRDAQSKLAALKPLESEQQEHEQFAKLVAQRDEAMSKTAGSLLLNNYRSAVAVMTDASWSDPRICPTCESTVPTSLLEQLQEKLAAYEKTEEATTAITALWTTASWPTRWRAMEQNSDINPEGGLDDCDQLSNSFKNGTVTVDQLAQATSELAKLDDQRKDVLKTIEEEIKKLESSLPASMVAVTRQIAAAKQAAADLAKYQELKPKLEQVTNQVARREAWKNFIAKAHRDFAAAESALVESRQHAIAARSASMHDDITRNPDVVPALDRPTGSERLRLRLDQFYGLTDLSANTLLQESYCNSIAISIFLSTAIQRPGIARFIILDDITSSFDGGHQYNLMELLRTKLSPAANSDGLQIILLTHDTLLEKYLDRATNTGTWRHQKLIGRPPNGPVLTEQHNTNHVRQRAENYLQTGQTDAAKPWIRQYLESVLSRVIRKVSIRVPLDYAMDDNKKMVQNALEAIKAEIDLHSAAGNIVLSPQQLQDVSNTLLPALLGNVLAHYATGPSTGVSANVLLGVLDDVDKLADCFKYDCTCQQAGQTTRRFYRNLTTRACNC